MNQQKTSPSKCGALVSRLAGMTALIAGATMLLCLPASAKTKPAPQPQVGDVLIAGGVAAGGSTTASAEFYSVKKRKFFVTGSMSTPRAGHQMAWMPASPERTVDHGVAVGGFTGSATITGASSIAYTMNVLNSVDIYTLSSGTFAADAAPLNNGRAFFAALALPGDLPTDFLQGHLLMIDGICNAGDLESCRTADILHPDADDITATSNPKVASMMETLTYLADGTALMAGGIDDFAGDITNTAEVFTPANEFFNPVTATMNVARAGHTATRLNDGTVLIVGGITNNSGVMTALNSAEIYDPAAQTFTAVPATMTAARVGHTATLLKDGRVLIAGGFAGTFTFSVSGASDGVTLTFADENGSILNTAELYDPATKTFKPVGGIVKKTGLPKAAMKSARFYHTATLLSNGKVLLTGGFGPSSGALGELNTGELFTANKNKNTLGAFAKTPVMTSARALHTAVAVEQ